MKVDKSIKYKKKDIWKNNSIEDMDGEVWKDCPEFEGMYEVSNMGRVKSLQRKTPIILKQQIKEKKDNRTKIRSYLEVSLSKDGIQINILVHKLVAKVFLKEEKQTSTIHHKKHKLDNRAVNLYYYD